jgi:hypothetical protein
MSATDLRKELKELRKKAMPTPVSRMKKTDVVREIERLKGLHHVEETKVKEVMEKAEVPKKIAKKVSAVQEKEHSKQEEVVKKTKSVKAMAEAPKEGSAKSATTEKPKAKKAPKEAPKEEKPKAKKAEAEKPTKGSEEMRERMARLRAMRKKKDE